MQMALKSPQGYNGFEVEGHVVKPVGKWTEMDRLHSRGNTSRPFSVRIEGRVDLSRWDLVYNTHITRIEGNKYFITCNLYRSSLTLKMCFILVPSSRLSYGATQ